MKLSFRDFSTTTFALFLGMGLVTLYGGIVYGWDPAKMGGSLGLPVGVLTLWAAIGLRHYLSISAEKPSDLSGLKSILRKRKPVVQETKAETVIKGAEAEEKNPFRDPIMPSESDFESPVPNTAREDWMKTKFI